MVSRAKAELPEKAQATDELNWSQIAHDLELDAISRQLALNAIVIEYQNNHLQLGILPELEVMLKPELEQQIKQAIESRLGVSLKLDFKSLPELKFETPQQAATRRREERRQAVIEQIHQDPVVGQLKQVFGAELIEQSVREQSTKR